MPATPVTAAIRDNSTRYGIATILSGLALLVGLRLWASPLTREITGRGANGLFEFLLIPAFLLVVTAGILLFLWEPDRDAR